MPPTEFCRHLILVLDTSESAGASAVAALRDTALRLADQLAPNELFSIVTYASHAHVRLALTPMNAAARAQLPGKLRHWESGGNTNLEAGWMAAMACHSAWQARAPATPAHILLTLDGRANEGATEPAALAQLGRLAAGARTILFGLGLHCSLPQLEALAAGAGGEVRRVLLPTQLPAAATVWFSPGPSARACTAGRCG